MNKIVYRESAESVFEHVAYIDGLILKMDNGVLMIRELIKFEPQLMPSGEFELQAVHEWIEMNGPWEVDTTERLPGVYAIETSLY